ncbi:MAG: DNA gyrase subunit A [Planctomycetaceae bacterium]|nr:DNA gyrase subunit A [Planctomycetaceae bacterium]
MSSDDFHPVDHSSESNEPNQNPDAVHADGTPLGLDIHQGQVKQLSIEDELRGSYLTYAMSVIVSRALPDVRDGLKPSQRRILVAMNDLNLGPSSKRIKCAKISGDTSGNYHPHGEGVVYPTLVRMAQEWNMRHVLVDKQGNFGSIAGLPPAAMRYTEARMSPFAAMMLEDLEYDTVDYLPTYDERNTEPSVLPSKFPNLLVNGTSGIAVGMATSIPPHNLAEVCDAAVAVIDRPGISPDELLQICPGPDFPTGGIICGRGGIRRGYLSGRGNILVRARAKIEETNKRARIVVSEIPFQQARDRVEEKIAEMVHAGKIVGISNIRNESDLKEPVRLILELKRDADPEVVLNQLYQFTTLQDTFSINLLALVDGKPRLLSFKEMVEEFLRHRLNVIRRRTQFLLARARRRKHTVEGLMIAHANIDEVIRVIRTSKTQAEAKERLMTIECPSSMLHRALGDDGFSAFQSEHGTSEAYTLTPIQADAILRMTLGHLVNLEQEKLGDEFRNLLSDINEYLRILSDEKNILKIIRDDLLEIKRKYGEKRLTEISGDEVGEVDIEDLITEETMVVSISNGGYIKRTPASLYRAQRRGGKGRVGAKVADEDPIQHLFVATTHNYLLFFTTEGKVYWHKVYNLPELPPTSKGRAIVNMLNLAEGEEIADCRAIKDFNAKDHYLVLVTRKGLVKKTKLSEFGRPLKRGLIAINLKEGDELIDTAVVGPGDELIISTANGMAIRFRHTDARPMGRASSGVKGIKLGKDDYVVAAVLASPDRTLLTACANGYGKRTPIGPNAATEPEKPGEDDEDDSIVTPESSDHEEPDNDILDNDADIDSDADGEDGNGEDDEKASSSRSYRTIRRGGKGLRDIKATKRNGKVIGAVRVYDDDEVMMITAHGQIQRIAVKDIRIMGRNTQGVRIMTLDDGDALVAVKRIPKDEHSAGDTSDSAKSESDASEHDTSEHEA